MKRVSHLQLSQGLFSIMIWMFDLRTKHRLAEAALWDIIFVHYYILKNNKAPSLYALRMLRYGKKTTYHSLRLRLDSLIEKGLIYQHERRIYPSELLLKDLSGFLKLEEIESILPVAA